MIVFKRDFSDDDDDDDVYCDDPCVDPCDYPELHVDDMTYVGLVHVPLLLP